jgi:hypothetical protein
MGRACGTYEGEQRRIQGRGGEPEGRLPLGTHRCKTEDNIKKAFQVMGWDGMGWRELD